MGKYRLEDLTLVRILPDFTLVELAKLGQHSLSRGVGITLGMWSLAPLNFLVKNQNEILVISVENLANPFIFRVRGNLKQPWSHQQNQLHVYNRGFKLYITSTTWEDNTAGVLQLVIPLTKPDNNEEDYEDCPDDLEDAAIALPSDNKLLEVSRKIFPKPIKALE